MPDWYKALLLDAPITPGQTFGPVVDEMLQRSHCAQEFMKELVRLLPKQPPPVCKPAANWHPRSELSAHTVMVPFQSRNVNHYELGNDPRVT
ncbi:UNVERIFIED_CONTAM: hypothetical protein FKN15_050848 [Acipenser sinensis]